MLVQLGKNARKAAARLGTAGIEEKNHALLAVADALEQQKEYLLEENQKDIKNAKESGMTEALIDRLALTEARIEGMSEGIRQVAALEDPIGEVMNMKKRPNGLLIGQKRVPLGVIGIIYESRPNVTADAFSLCFKTGNAVILRGGSDAIYSNTAITSVIRSTLEDCGMTADAIQLVTDTSRETATKLMQLNDYIDVLIPRGGAGLIQAVVKNATVPVIETGTGNCHVYVDEFADLDMAVSIIVNAKTQRLGTCNTCESLVIHSKIADQAVPRIASALKEKDIEIRGDERSRALDGDIVEATEEDWGTEYLDRIISMRIVDSIEEAILHINTYNTKHSEAIVTADYANAQKFLNEIDAAAVYVNASTRFTDGFEFGFGAEIGISTQKIHARGPMGLLALTTTKYIIYGNGQIRG
ncbi:MAG: glutamate-5-semialdehyde dehydrogenase [Anaerostipes sp.]|uniref:glutamate-5-semialdehyde dehydrogenase n=1 Tax=Anaerostipes sp. 992a TaxID=1261637 RepID=UPI00095197E6|nr:glutamate-5-semialdehyde dehydrogenase [Anaerostipes sp. 992a]MCI5952684.1 glutamate-5-semialdehyde dehydrogenase [Anaerostipes sp.]OLR63981.1 glutamate-5-semialdehyde dehydrogenase [Anaerostipes sp. 992a]